MKRKFEHISTRPVPYNTGKVLIGCRYDPFPGNHMDREGEFAQSLLLGDYGYRKRQKVQTVLYVVALVAAFALMGWLS